MNIYKMKNGYLYLMRIVGVYQQQYGIVYMGCGNKMKLGNKKGDE
jgi:hypothetical protein